MRTDKIWFKKESPQTNTQQAHMKCINLEYKHVCANLEKEQLVLNTSKHPNNQAQAPQRACQQVLHVHLPIAGFDQNGINSTLQTAVLKRDVGVSSQPRLACKHLAQQIGCHKLDCGTRKRSEPNQASLATRSRPCQSLQ